MLENTMFSLI